MQQLNCEKGKYDSIGHITLSGRFNYGNRLQCYAMQHVLSDYCYQVDTLEFCEEKPVAYIKKLAKLFLRRPTVTSETKMSPDRRKAFEAFQSLLSTKEVSIFDPAFESEYQLFVVGSDQVWNPRFMQRYRNPELLRFAPKEKSIALAASIGVRELDSRSRRVFAKALQNFKSISVREESASKIIYDLTGRAPVVVVDPTLMLDASTWHSIANDGLVPDEPYVFVYCLGDKNGKVYSFCKEIKETYGATRVVWLSDNDDGTEIAAGPSEFVSLIEHAQVVVTDSFHGSIFSIIFEKEFFVFRRAGSIDMFSRIETLLSELSLWGRFVDLDQGLSSANLMGGIDYVASRALLAEQQDNFNQYLQMCFSEL